MEEEINLLDLLFVIKKYLKFIIGIFFISVIATMIILLLKPKEYKATATILPPMTSEEGIMANLPSGISGIIKEKTTPTDIFVAILKSRSMKDDIIDKFNLVNIYKCETREEARKKVEDNTEIKVTKEKTITVSYIDTDKERARDIANFYILNLDKKIRELNITNASQKRKFIEERLEDTKKSLKDIEERLKNYQIGNKVVIEKDMGEVAVGELQGRLIAKKIELEAKQKFTTPNNPDIIKLKNEIEEMEKQIMKLPPIETESARLIREYKTQETLYTLLVSEYEKAKIEEARDTPTVQVCDWATTPEKKYRPKIKMSMAVSGIVSLFFGVFLSFFLEYIEKTKQELKQKNITGG
jgi:tyrosine-protein kinase Etk/Wzc